MLTALFRADFLRLAALFQSTEETRYYLNGVHVEPAAGGGVVLVATDGHRLVAFYDSEGFVDAPMIVRAPKGLLAALRDVKKRAPAYLGFTAQRNGDARFGIMAADMKGGPALMVCSAQDAQDAMVDPLDPRIGWQGVVHLIDGDFPDWRRVLPPAMPPALPGSNAHPPVACVAQNRYVADFAKVAKALGDGAYAPVRFFPGDQGDPVRVDVGVPHFVGVLMPMRDGDAGAFGDVARGDARPEWAYESPAAVAAAPKKKPNLAAVS